MRLVKASPEPPEGLLDFLREVGAGENGFGGVPEVSRGELSLEAYLEREVARSQGESLPEGYVANTTYWLLDECGQIVGMGRLRHTLNEDLLHHGGHIGYYIRPTARGKGYGTRLLALVLEEARTLGIARALLTVNASNEHSWRLVEANGGIMEDERLNEDGSPFRRYWIDIAP
jgi:predicted acetyltransferase